MEGLEIFPTIMSIVVVLAVLGATLFILRWATTRTGSPRKQRRSTPLLEIVERQSLGRNSSLIVVRYAGTERVLGVTDSAITPIAEGTIDLHDLDEGPSEQSRKLGASNALESLRNKTVRR